MLRTVGMTRHRGFDVRVAPEVGCPTRGTGQIAVGAIVAKATKRIRMDRLRVIERRVHRWRDELEDTR